MILHWENGLRKLKFFNLKVLFQEFMWLAKEIYTLSKFVVTRTILSLTHWLICLQNHFKSMQWLAEAASNSCNFDYERVRNTPFITFKSIKETLDLILKKRKKIVERATVVKFQNKVCKLCRHLLYFTFKQGVKRSGNLQGSQTFRFGLLIFSQNWTIFKNVQNST